MPGQYRHTTDSLLHLAEELLKAGVDKMMLFGIPSCKDELGKPGLRPKRRGTNRPCGRLSNDCPSCISSATYACANIPLTATAAF